MLWRMLMLCCKRFEEVFEVKPDEASAYKNAFTALCGMVYTSKMF
jgi:hypothetical protein